MYLQKSTYHVDLSPKLFHVKRTSWVYSLSELWCTRQEWYPTCAQASLYSHPRVKPLTSCDLNKVINDQNVCVCVSVLSPGQARRYFESAKYISQTVWPSVKKRLKSKQYLKVHLHLQWLLHVPTKCLNSCYVCIFPWTYSRESCISFYHIRLVKDHVEFCKMLKDILG